MNYNEIENKYIKANLKVRYRFENALDVKKVLGYDFRTMRGFKDLSEDHKRLAERLICDFINGFGLEAREGIRPANVKREIKFKGFKVTLKDKRFSYLFDNGSIG